MRWVSGGLLALACVSGMGSSAGAQGIVPGGWGSQFGYQSFGGPGSGGMTFGGGYNYGMPGGAGGGLPLGAGMPGPFGYGVMANPSALGATRMGFPGNPATLGMPAQQTMSGMDPLMGAIRQSTRRSRRH